MEVETMEVKRITVNEVKRRMDSGEQMFIIDTRRPDAWDSADIKISGAVRIHFADLERHLNEIPRDRTIVTYCT
jgi:rhodanese-related sulfurtransferase